MLLFRLISEFHPDETQIHLFYKRSEFRRQIFHCYRLVFKLQA